MIKHFNFLRNKDYVHYIKVHYISVSHQTWNHLRLYIYIYHLYLLFGIICNEKYFHFYTWASHWTAGLSVKPSIQGKTPLGSLSGIYFKLFDLTCFFSFFSVITMKSHLAFSYLNTLIALIPWPWLVLLPVLIRLYYIN